MLLSHVFSAQKDGTDRTVRSVAKIHMAPIRPLYRVHRRLFLAAARMFYFRVRR